VSIDNRPEGAKESSKAEQQIQCAERAEGEQRFLAEASRLLAGSLDYETTLRTVAGLALPGLGAWCIVDLVEPDGSMRRLAIVGSAHETERIVR
jgi:hypothetical protein